MSNVLVLAEHQSGTLRKVNWPVLNFAKQTAELTDGEVYVAILGHDIDDLANELARYDVDKVIKVDDERLENYLPAEYASAISDLAEEYDAEVVTTVASFRGKDVMPRIAARLEAGMIADASAVFEDDDAEIAFKRPIWSGKLIEIQRASTDVVCVTARHTEFEALAPSDAGAPIEEADPEIESDGTEFVKFDAVESERPELTDADVVIAGGRGIRSRENFEMLEQLADLFGGAVGASRAAVDSGMAPNDWQIGQTGKIVAPKLYVAVAISGAIQHIAGMKGSKTIVAINKDPEAPIFQITDYGLVADAFKVVPELNEKLAKELG